MKHSPRFLNIVNETKQHIEETDIFDLKTKLDTNEIFHLIDVREDHEWNKGHIPKAIHLSKGIIERDIEQAIPDVDAKIYLYCGGGYRSALAAYNLQQMGYHNVVSVDGGMRAWREAGYTVEAT